MSSQSPVVVEVVDADDLFADVPRDVAADTGLPAASTQRSKGSTPEIAYTSYRGRSTAWMSISSPVCSVTCPPPDATIDPAAANATPGCCRPRRRRSGSRRGASKVTAAFGVSNSKTSSEPSRAPGMPRRRASARTASCLPSGSTRRGRCPRRAGSSCRRGSGAQAPAASRVDAIAESHRERSDPGGCQSSGEWPRA